MPTPFSLSTPQQHLSFLREQGAAAQLTGAALECKQKLVVAVAVTSGAALATQTLQFTVPCLNRRARRPLTGLPQPCTHLRSPYRHKQPIYAACPLLSCSAAPAVARADASNLEATCLDGCTFRTEEQAGLYCQDWWPRRMPVHEQAYQSLRAPQLLLCPTA